ncbi:MAG: hypothetical protein R3E95_16575 [Thiolinea sp.]
MADNKRTQRIRDLEEQINALLLQIRELEAEYTLETRVEEKQRQAARLLDKREILQEREAEYERLLRVEQVNKLRLKMLSEERNGRFDLALETAEELCALDPESADTLQPKMHKLCERQALYQPALETLGLLSMHIAALGMPLYEKLAEALHPKNRRDDLIQVLLPRTRQFLQEQGSDIDAYRQFCSKWLDNGAMVPDSGLGVDYADLCDKILNGHTVLFLGNGMAELYQHAGVNEQTLAQQLAAAIRYEGFSGNLSTIAELYQLRQGGQKTLLDNLQHSLPQDVQRFLAIPDPGAHRGKPDSGDFGV